jgi:hypothetical protein
MQCKGHVSTQALTLPTAEPYNELHAHLKPVPQTCNSSSTMCLPASEPSTHSDFDHNVCTQYPCIQ